MAPAQCFFGRVNINVFCVTDWLASMNMSTERAIRKGEESWQYRRELPMVPEQTAEGTSSWVAKGPSPAALAAHVRRPAAIHRPSTFEANP